MPVMLALMQLAILGSSRALVLWSAGTSWSSACWRIWQSLKMILKWNCTDIGWLRERLNYRYLVLAKSGDARNRPGNSNSSLKGGDTHAELISGFDSKKRARTVSFHPLEYWLLVWAFNFLTLVLVVNPQTNSKDSHSAEKRVFKTALTLCLLG